MIARRFVLGLSFALLVATPQAQAQESVARAEALFRAGRDAMRDNDYARACEQFRESDKLDPQPGTKLNLGACEEKRGRLATALDLFRSVQRELPAEDPRATIAKQRVEELDSKIPRVTFKLAPGAPPSTVVRLGKLELANATLGVAMPLDPGKHEVTVSAPGFAEKRFSLELGEGDTRDVEVAPGAKESDVALDTTTTEPTSGGSSNRTLGYVLGGVGIAGIAVGSIAGVIALGKKSTADDNCSDELEVCNSEGKDANDSGRTFATVSTVGFVVGVVGLGAGAYFLLTSDDSGKETGIAIRPNGNGASLSLRQTW